jgi:hypothetical protein
MYCDSAELDEALSRQYVITNTNIHEGKNPHIKLKNTGFTLSTPTQEESDAEPLQQFFPEPHYVPLLEILATVNHYSLDELQHWRQRHHHGRPLGTNSLRGRYRNRLRHRYPQNGPDLSSDQRIGIGAYRQLVLSLDNLIAANDRVLQFMDRLQLPNLCSRFHYYWEPRSSGQVVRVPSDILGRNPPCSQRRDEKVGLRKTRRSMPSSNREDSRLQRTRATQFWLMCSCWERSLWPTSGKTEGYKFKKHRTEGDHPG